MQIVDRTRGLWRLLRVVIYTARTLFYTLWRVNRGATVAEGLEIRRVWSAGFVRRMGFRIRWEGEIPSDTCLYVGNHRCHVDPQVVMGKVLAFPVSRAEVRNWPFVGKGSEATGIIFVDKSSRESRLRAKSILLDELRKGNSILIFPEGHTNVKPLTSTFQKGSFEQAAAGQFKVIPFVIEYKDTRDYWDHSDSFAVHFIKRFGKKITDVVVAIGPPIISDNPWTLLRSSQQWIDEKIKMVRQEWDRTR